MSKEVQPKKTRSTKKVTEGSNTAELEAKIAELEAKLANLSSQVKPAEQKPAQTSKPQPRPAASGPTHGTLPAGMKPAEAPKPEPKPQPRPAASGPTHGTLPAGMKPAPKPETAPEVSAREPLVGEVAPAYAKISSTGYTGNKYFATRKRLSYHPADKQFTGSSTTTATTTTTAPPAPAPEHQSQTSTSRGTLPAGMKPQEKKSLWKAKGSDVAETYVSEEEHKAPPPQPRPAASGPTHGTLPAGMKPAEAPTPEPKPQPRPAASGPTHGTLPAGMKPPPKPEATLEQKTSANKKMAGEIAP